MTAPNNTLPEGWSKTTADEMGWGRYQFRLNEENGATVLVWVIVREEYEPFQIRLTTISDAGNQVRHDYPIDTYETKEAALDEAEAFVDELASRLRNGHVSNDDPAVEAIQRLIDEFNGLTISTRLRRFLGGLGP